MDNAYANPPSHIQGVLLFISALSSISSFIDSIVSYQVFAARRLQQDSTTISSPKSTNPERTRRSWDLWTPESKDWFFDALCEFGKDFDAIYNSMAAKSRKSKTPQGEMSFKNKDQVRYFYYRTWHKVSKALGDLGEMKKSVQELYGLINYSEMRKKIGFKALNPTNAPRLLELVATGQTIIKVKGKNFRVKTPVCRALRLINNVPDKGWEGPKIPAQIVIDLRPLDNAAWTHVQTLAQNPRVRVTCLPQRKVASIVDLLEDRWQPGHVKKKNALLAALEGLETPQELKNSIFQFAAAPQKLRLRVFPNQQPKAIEFFFADTYSSSDVCLNSYRLRFAKREEEVGSKPSTEPKNPDSKVDPHGMTLETTLATGSTFDLTARSFGEIKEDKLAAAQPGACAPAVGPNKQTCDMNLIHPLTAHLNGSTRRDSKITTRLVTFGGINSERIERSVSALVNEEANDGLASNLGGQSGPGGQAIVTEEKAKLEKEGPVGDGWTAESLSMLTVGDLYLRLGCPSNIVLYYKFEGADFPAPENRTRNVMDKLITVLLASFCDKRSAITQPKQIPMVGVPAKSRLQTTLPLVSVGVGQPPPLPPKPKRERLLERAARDLPTEFAVPQGQAPRAFKKALDSIRVELPVGNKRQRARRKPISAMVLQRPLLPRSNPVVGGTVQAGGVGVPQSVPSGVVVRNIVPAGPSAPSPDMETSLDKIISTSVAGEISLERIIASTIINAEAASPLPDIVPEGAGQAANQARSKAVQLEKDISLADATDAASDLRLSVQSSSDSLETPKKVPFSLNELDQGPSMSSLDFSPLLSTPNKQQWLNNEGSNLSLGALLNSFESPLKAAALPTGPPDSNSNLESRLPDVESHLQSLMNESSLDYASKFADLAAQIARQTSAGAGTSE